MPDFEDLVRAEAYLIWEAEGRPEGQHDRHWRLALERVRLSQSVRIEAPVIPLPFKRVALSTRPKSRRDAVPSLRASA